MSRSLSCLCLTGTVLLVTASAAFAKDVPVDDSAIQSGDPLASAPIVGGDSTLEGLTGLVSNPEAYTAGPNTTVVGLSWVRDDKSSASLWIPSILAGIQDQFEIGAWGNLSSDNAVQNRYGASAKWKFYDERHGSDVTIHHEHAESGLPSIAGWYAYEHLDDIDRHRLGLTTSWTFSTDETDSDNSKTDESLNNSSFTAGAIYNFIDDRTTGQTLNLDNNGFDWYVGANFVPDPAWSIALEYEAGDDDADVFQSHGFAGAVRYHFDSSASKDEQVTNWMVQAGVQNQRDLVIGVQASF